VVLDFRIRKNIMDIIRDDTELRLALADNDTHAYALAAIKIGLSYTDDLMITHYGMDAVSYWRVFGEVLPWE
jgi:hypothetical protein